MSDAYEDDRAREQAIFDQIEAANAAADYEEPANAGGRPHKAEPIKVVAWRQAHNASIAGTAKRWGISPATVKRLCREYGAAATAERKRWQCEQLDREAARHAHGLWRLYNGQLARALYRVEVEWMHRCEQAKGTGQEEAVNTAMAAALEQEERQFTEGWARIVGPVPDYAAPF